MKNIIQKIRSWWASHREEKFVAYINASKFGGPEPLVLTTHRLGQTRRGDLTGYVKLSDLKEAWERGKRNRLCSVRVLFYFHKERQCYINAFSWDDGGYSLGCCAFSKEQFGLILKTAGVWL